MQQVSTYAEVKPGDLLLVSGQFVKVFATRTVGLDVIAVFGASGEKFKRYSWSKAQKVLVQ